MRLRTLGLIVTLALSILAPLAAGAQQAAKVFRIGILAPVPPDAAEVSPLFKAFLKGCGNSGTSKARTL